MKKLLFLVASVTLSIASNSQSDTVRLFSEKLLIDVPFVDFPYLKHAAAMSYNKRLNLVAEGSEKPTFQDYLRSYESLSMAQSLAITKDLNSTNYYFQNKLWNKWLVPDTKEKRFLNRVAANGTAGLIDYLMAYQLMVFSPVWNHEEFHRNGLTLQHISSFDDTYYRLGGSGDAGGSVSRVLDEDLIKFKKVSPVGLVRSFEAGIESQYQLVRNMQKDDFFQHTDYANVIFHILITKQAVDYVNQFKARDYDVTIDSMNYYGKTVADRDFVGWDFTPWVYDLFRPNEPYEARGTHPNGIGINRIIKRSSLTSEEDAYLLKMGRLQYINFITPFMVGIKEIRMSSTTSFNFALRHYPTSFGYNMNMDIFLTVNNKQWLVGLHTYTNKNNTYPGVEVFKPSVNATIFNKPVGLQYRAMLWVQPKDESFYATAGKFGGLLGARASYGINKFTNFYIELEGKSNGWVAGNPYLSNNLTTRLGLSMDIQKSRKPTS